MNTKYFRYTLGFILLALILFAFYYSKSALIIASAFFIIIAMIEYRNMFKQKAIYPHKILPEIIGITCATIFTLSHDISSHTLVTPLMISGMIFSFGLTVIKNKKPYLQTSLSTIAAILLIICGLYIIKLTYYYEGNNSFTLIFVYFIAILCGDFAASKIGPKFPHKLLSKEISPNKTVAGAISNIIVCTIISTTLTKFVNLSLIESISFGIIISIFAQLGDLTISTFKRELNIKHSSNFFFEYGGILDRMDAFIFSAPAAYYYLFLITLF